MMAEEEKEFNLKEKRCSHIGYSEFHKYHYHEAIVEEFIRRLKHSITRKDNYIRSEWTEWAHKEIDKLSGGL